MYKYNNRLFNVDILTGHELIILGILNIHSEGLTTSKLIDKLTNRATNKCCISDGTLTSCIDTLKKLNMINVIDGNKRAGKENFYKIISQDTYGTGYIVCSNGAIYGVIDRSVTPGEFKLYILLLKYAFKKDNCYPSQTELSNELKVTQEEIISLFNGLEKGNYIKKNIIYGKGIESLEYTLLM